MAKIAVSEFKKQISNRAWRRFYEEQDSGERGIAIDYFCEGLDHSYWKKYPLYTKLETEALAAMSKLEATSYENLPKVVKNLFKGKKTNSNNSKSVMS